jgi:hypothetical protein
LPANPGKIERGEAGEPLEDPLHSRLAEGGGVSG